MIVNIEVLDNDLGTFDSHLSTVCRELRSPINTDLVQSKSSGQVIGSEVYEVGPVGESGVREQITRVDRLSKMKFGHRPRLSVVLVEEPYCARARDCEEGEFALVRIVHVFGIIHSELAEPFITVSGSRCHGLDLVLNWVYW